MRLRTLAARLLAVAFTLLAIPALAQTLYAARGSNGQPGVLFTVNPATAVSTVVANILVGAAPISMTGIASHPATAVLYGAVGNGSPNFANNLVTIDPVTGAATVIGAFGAQVSDIAFNAAGTLFAWNRTANRLATVNLATGALTTFGASGLAAFSAGGGIGISAGGVAFVSVSATGGTLDSVNTGTGVGTTGPALSAVPIGGAINAMAFSGATLFAVDSNQSGSPTTNNLVTINTATGAVTNIGALPGDIDAIAFAGAPAGPVGVPTLSEWALVALALLMGLFGVALMYRRRA